MKFKPFIDSSSLMNDLKEMELTAAKALEYFRSTRHIFLYYEDLIRDPTVRTKKIQSELNANPQITGVSLVTHSTNHNFKLLVDAWRGSKIYNLPCYPH